MVAKAEVVFVDCENKESQKGPYIIFKTSDYLSFFSSVEILPKVKLHEPSKILFEIKPGNKANGYKQSLKLLGVEK